MSVERRNVTQLSESLNRRLTQYALAAGATGVGLMALAQPAEAKIVFHRVHRVIGPGHNYSLNLNHDKVTDFTIHNYYGCNQDYCVGILSAIPAAGNGVEGAKGFLGIPYAYALSGGALIGPKQPFSGQLMASDNMGTLGRWLNVNNRYLGLRFQIKRKTHYGWARLSVVDSNTRITATMTAYAYETIPNKAIIAGKTKGPDVITLEPGSLGTLAAGSPKLSNWRQK